MTDELKFPDRSDALDERTARAIRDAYLPPVSAGVEEHAYWRALEKRIMSRIDLLSLAERDLGWWSVLNNWAEVGLVAAAALFAIGGAISTHLGEPDEQVAYDSVIQKSIPDALTTPAAVLTASDESSQRDAALQYVLSY
jgi:hypothetical protein